ncbi:MAG: hypothetical protein AB7D39_06595 [Pseudodesulfovibrio sp.]|uniref:hypothetical protein n=1 Tax=Pseudodesulfovibrio sp. TaxID=2035812 RepID=UPI003D1430FE
MDNFVAKKADFERVARRIKHKNVIFVISPDVLSSFMETPRTGKLLAELKAYPLGLLRKWQLTMSPADAVDSVWVKSEAAPGKKTLAGDT